MEDDPKSAPARPPKHPDDDDDDDDDSDDGNGAKVVWQHFHQQAHEGRTK